MKLRILALTLTVALATAAVAMAATSKLTGKVKGDGNSSVSMKVVVKKSNGVTGPTRVKGLTFKKVSYTCAGGETGEQSVKLGSTTVGLVGFPKKFYLFYINKTVKGIKYEGSGKINKSGTRAKGTMEFGFTKKAPDGVGDVNCSADVSFSAKRKR